MEKLSERTIEERLDKFEGWDYVDGAIEASFKFKDFKEAFSMMTRIAFDCETHNHHPDWTNVYNSLKIRLNTHDAKGVTDKDFELAHTINKIIENG